MTTKNDNSGKNSSLFMVMVQVAGMLTSVYSSSSHPFTPLAKFVYDSVMTLAIALNKTAEMHRSNQSLEQTDCQNKSGIFTSLENFSFDNDLMGCILLYNLRNTEFDGLTVSDLCYLLYKRGRNPTLKVVGGLMALPIIA